MKNVLMLVLIFISSLWASLAANAATHEMSTQHRDRMFAENTIWCCVISADHPKYGCSKSVNIMGGDTVIGEYTYQKMLNRNYEYMMSIREDGKKVYAYIDDEDKDVLMYDFGLEVGDTMPIINRVNIEGSFDPHLPLSWKVIAVDSITLMDGRRAKRIHYDNLEADIEYVGRSRGFFRPLESPYISTCGGPILCCSLNGEPIYEGGQGYCDLLFEFFTMGTPMPHATTWRGVEYVKYDAPNESQSFTSDVTYTLGGDTTIQRKRYSKLLLTYEREKLVNSYRGAIRQTLDGEKVYYVPNGKINGVANDKEYLLYDFAVKAGDVVKAYNGWEDISCVELYDEDAIMPEWTVTTVPVIAGRRHVYVTNKDYGDRIWIEGVGTKNILWTQGRSCYATGGETRMRRTLCALDSEGKSLNTFNTSDMGIINHCTSWETSVEQIKADQSSHQPASATKLLRDGQMYIEHDGKTYSVTGQEVK